jgi:hypothetical protein
MKTERLRPAERFFGKEMTKAIGQFVQEAVMKGGKAEDFLEASHKTAGVGRIVHNMFPGDSGTSIAFGNAIHEIERLSKDKEFREKFLKNYKVE